MRGRALPSGALLATLALVQGSLFLACGGEPPADSDSTPAAMGGGEAGRLVIVGGALQTENAPVYQAILDGRDGEGPLCVIPTASGTPQRSMDGYVSVFDSLAGPGTAHGVLLTEDRPGHADDEDVAQELAACSGFFFTGGSQDRVSAVFRPDGRATGAYRAVVDRFREGAVVSGSSAGAAIMTDPMISGGGSLEALEYGVTRQEGADGVWITRGLGFLAEGIIDQHFLARGRWGRLLVTVLNGEGEGLGFGIDENTALVVEGDSARVIGESGVVVLNARSASRPDSGNGASGVLLYLLGRNDVIHLPGGEVHWDPGKSPVPGGRGGEPPSDLDVFSPWSLLDLLSGLAAGTWSKREFSVDGYIIELAKGQGFQALGVPQEHGGEGIRGAPEGLGLGPVTVALMSESPSTSVP